MNLYVDKCEFWLRAGLAYERGETYLMSDEDWDQLSLELHDNYDKLPVSFRSIVSMDDLRTGSAACLFEYL